MAATAATAAMDVLLFKIILFFVFLFFRVKTDEVHQRQMGYDLQV